MMAVLRPLKVVIENYPDGVVEELEAVNNPEDPTMGTARFRSRKFSISSRTTFERFRRRNISVSLPGRRSGLRYAYIIKCVGVVKDEKTGEVIELRCTYDPETRERFCAKRRGK